MAEERKLTERQKRFADFYIETCNATESYKRAGYSFASDNIAAVEGSKLLRKPKILGYIDEILGRKDNERIASQDEVLEFLTSVMRGEMTEEVVFNGDVGIVKDIKGTDIKDRVAAAKELSKRYEVVKRLELDERKVIIAEKQVDDLDDDIEYVVEDEENEEGN